MRKKAEKMQTRDFFSQFCNTRKTKNEDVKAPAPADVSMFLSTHLPDSESVEQAAGKPLETSRTEIPQNVGWISIRGQDTQGLGPL